MKRLDVVAGILEDRSGRVLITERVDDGPFHGLWEFPGGKIKAGESPHQALARELIEEIGVDPIESRHFIRVRHDYPDRAVAIDFFLVSSWRNEPRGLEGQAMNWTAVASLDTSVLLPANQAVVAALQKRFCKQSDGSNGYNSSHSGEIHRP